VYNSHHCERGHLQDRYVSRERRVFARLFRMHPQPSRVAERLQPAAITFRRLLGVALVFAVGCVSQPPDASTPGCSGAEVAADGTSHGVKVKRLAPGTYELAVDAGKVGPATELTVQVTCRAGYDDVESGAATAVALPTDSTHVLVTTIGPRGAPADQAFYVLLCGAGP